MEISLRLCVETRNDPLAPKFVSIQMLGSGPCFTYFDDNNVPHLRLGGRK